MSAGIQNFTKLYTLKALALSILTSVVCGEPIADRLDAIESRLVRIEQVVLPAPVPATQPTSQPAPEPQPTPVRADTLQAVRAAILNGARWIQTTGIDVVSDLDARGATIELLPGGPNWKPAVALANDASLVNATIRTPPSTFNAAGQRTGFFKAMTATGRNMTLRNVTFAPDTGFCIHLFQGRLTMESVKATTFSEYFIFQEAGTFASAKWCEVKGGSRSESVWRASAANYLIEESLLDNSAGGKAVLRGDSPGTDDQPGGVARRTKFVGQVGVNPLTEDDGGQMIGIDRWRFAEGWLYQLPYTRKPETLAFARQMYLSGALPSDIVRATADHFIDGKEFAKVAKGKTRLTDNDIKLTLEFRAKEVGRHSRILLEDCEIVGDLRLNARMTGTIRRTRIQSTGANAPLSGNSQATYPFPVDRTIVGGEQQPPPQVTFDGVEIIGGTSIGLDLKNWPSLKFINGSKYNDIVLSAAPVDRLFNSTAIDLPGVTRIRTDGGLTFRDGLSRSLSAWVGGYDGPGGITARPAPWTPTAASPIGRWREYDPARIRAYARSLNVPVFVLDIEHWEVDPTVHGEETARKWIQRLADICQIIKHERPDIVVGCYDILPASNYWALANWAAWQRWKESGEKNNELPDAWWAAKEGEYRSAFETWQRTNDFTAAILRPHVDALFPSVYPSYRMTQSTGEASPVITGSLAMDRDVVRLKIEEARRVADGKPIYPFYWPVITEDGGEVVGAERTANTVEAAFASGATGVVIWSDVRPRELLEQTVKAARSAQPSQSKSDE